MQRKVFFFFFLRISLWCNANCKALLKLSIFKEREGSSDLLVGQRHNSFERILYPEEFLYFYLFAYWSDRLKLHLISSEVSCLWRLIVNFVIIFREVFFLLVKNDGYFEYNYRLSRYQKWLTDLIKCERFKRSVYKMSNW